MASHASAEVRRRQILEAAMQCFGEKGFHAARIDDIARCAGLSKGAIYWQFDSKEEIFVALFDAYEAAIFAEWDELADDDALEALRRSGEIALRQMLGSRELLDSWTEFLRHDVLRDRLASVYRKSRARLAVTIERGVASGTLRPCDSHELAAALTALVEGLLLQAFVDPKFDALTAWPGAFAALSQGIALEPESKRAQAN